MNFQRGSVVCSRAGHDKGSFYTVIRIQDGFAYVADGYRRKSDDPKKKNILHLAYTETILSDEILNDDSKIRQALRAYQKPAHSGR